MTASNRLGEDELKIQIRKRIAELEKTNQDLHNEILERKQEKHKINRYNSVLEGINRIFGSIVKAETEEELGNKCLSIALEVTGSQIGFVGEVGADGLLHDIAISDMECNQCNLYNKTGHSQPAGDFILHGLYGYVVDSGKGFFTNNPQLDPHSIGLPKGHPPLTSFLGVPLILDEKIVGILAVANRENGYSLDQQEDLEAFAPAVIQVLQRKREEKEKQKADEILKEGEEKYKALFENSLDAILFAFPEGTIYAANPAACQMFGMKEEEIIRSGRNGIIDTSDPRLKLALEERSRTGRFKGEFNYRRKDGTIFPGDMSSTIFKDKSGILRAVIIIRDVTKRKQVEEALKHSEKQYRTLGDTIPYGVWLTDAAGYCTYVSNSFLELVGMSMEQVQKFGWLHLLPPEDVQPTIDHWLHCIQTGEDFEREHRFKAKNGSYRNVLAIGRPIKNEEGKITEWVGFNLDITERKQIEDALKRARDSFEEKVKERTVELDKSYNSLKESEKSLAEAQKIAHIGNWEWDIAADKAYWSDELHRIFGLRPQESEITYALSLNCIHPEDRYYVDNAVKDAFKGEPYSIDYRIISADGKEHTVHAYGEVIFNDENIPILMRGTVQDITERKKTEEKIQMLANVVESSDDAIITESLDCIITSWNKGAEQVYGYSTEEILGKPISILAPSQLEEETRELVERIKQGEGIQQYETLRLRKDGKILNVSITLSPVFDIYGKLIAVSLIYRDITKRKEAEEALAKIEITRQKEIHHRIKNNLQVISSLLDLQAEKFKDRKCINDSEVLEAFRESHYRVLSIALIHEELHEGEGEDALNFSLYLQRLVENLFHSYRLGDSNISLNMSLEKDISFDMDIAVPLGMIVNELLSNSLKYAFPDREAGEIRIILHRKGDTKNEKTEYVLTISDNGIGIPENIDFESSETLGLQLVNILVEQLEGKIEFKRDKGTEFITRFNVEEKEN